MISIIGNFIIQYYAKDLKKIHMKLLLLYNHISRGEKIYPSSLINLGNNKSGVIL